MKKIIVSAVVVVAFLGYFWFQHQNQSTDIVGNPDIGNINPNANDTPTPMDTPVNTVQPTSNPTSNSTPTPTKAVGFKDGTYTSAVADATYGPLQFKVVVQGGAITDVQFLQYPTAADHSREVSNSSLPVLKQETIVSQSANVHIVSGATQLQKHISKHLEVCWQV